MIFQYQSGSSILSIICLKTIYFLLKAIFQNSGMIQRCLNKAFESFLKWIYEYHSEKFGSNKVKRRNILVFMLAVLLYLS